jgi:hypothetical protein
MTAVVDTGMITTPPPTGNGQTWTFGTLSQEWGIEFGASNLGLVPSGESGYRITFPYQAQLMGGGPVRLYLQDPWKDAGTGTLYWRMRIRMDSSWSSNGNVSLKLLEPATTYNGASVAGTNHVVYCSVGSASPPTFPGSTMALSTGLQWSTGPNHSEPTASSGAAPNTAADYSPSSAEYTHASLNDGVWHTLEALYVAENPGGAYGGSIQMWVDGTSTMSYADVAFFSGTTEGLSTDQTPGWNSVVIEPTYGGGLNPVDSYPPKSEGGPGTIWYDMDELYMSVK